MSYHRALGMTPGEFGAPMTPTTLFAEAVDPYAWRFGPPGAVYAPYGWGPDFNIGMPFNYTHHLDYVRTPIPGARRNIGPYYDTLSPQRVGVPLLGMRLSAEELNYRTRYPLAIGPPDMVPITWRGQMRYVKLTPNTMRIRRWQERHGVGGTWSGGAPGFAAEAPAGALAGVLAVL